MSIVDAIYCIFAPCDDQLLVFLAGYIVCLKSLQPADYAKCELCLLVMSKTSCDYVIHQSPLYMLAKEHF